MAAPSACVFTLNNDQGGEQRTSYGKVSTCQASGPCPPPRLIIGDIKSPFSVTAMHSRHARECSKLLVDVHRQMHVKYTSVRLLPCHTVFHMCAIRPPCGENSGPGVRLETSWSVVCDAVSVEQARNVTT